MPKTSVQIHSGYIASIRDADSPVKPKLKNVTESVQFKRWFGDWQRHTRDVSKIQNADGSPIAPVVIDGYAKQNNVLLDSNAVTSIHGRNNAVTKLLANALNDYTNGQNTLFYWNKKQAIALLQKTRVVMPKDSAQIHDGYIASIRDAGKAALDGFADVEGTKIMVYYPVDGVSTIQKLQMVTQRGSNVQVCAIRGNFDDAQSAVKKIFTDKDSIRKLDEQGMTLSSANSINWGRLAPQIAYYVSAYCDMLNRGDIQMGDAINVCVPTGNFGNILAAYFAKQMGVPIAKLICASNENNVLTDFFRSSGTYDRNRPFHTTISPSMDILISSNLERLLFLVSGYNDAMVADLMKQLNETGKYSVPADVFETIGNQFEGGFCDDVQTKQTIAQLFDEKKYLADTHTAVAVKVYEDYRERTGDTTPTVIASTASPFKFCQSVISALGGTVSSDGTELLDQLHDMTGAPIPAPLAALSGLKPRFDLVIDRENILNTVDLLGQI